jgi:hypothetical protein
MELTMFNTDSGNYDIGRQTPLPRATEENVIFKQAYDEGKELGRDWMLVVKTSVTKRYPGAWYIKGYTSPLSYEEILHRLYENQQRGWRSCRVAYLIRIE